LIVNTQTTPEQKLLISTQEDSLPKALLVKEKDEYCMASVPDMQLPSNIGAQGVINPFDRSLRTT
jgi:hypothetical protein